MTQINGNTSILIVEDEELYRLKLEAFILELGFTLLTSTDNSEDALNLILKEKPDIVLMDIKINGKLNGIEVAEKLNHTNTVFLFITSFNDRINYTKAKKTSFIGYLIKPFDQLTLQSVIESSIIERKKYLENTKSKELEIRVEEKDSILIKHNTQLYKVLYSDILYIEAKGKLSVIHTPEKNLISNTTLSKYKEKLPQNIFTQVHKSYIINTSKTSKVISKNNELFIKDEILPIGRVYKEAFLKRFDIF